MTRPLHELHADLIAHCDATGGRHLADELRQRSKQGRPGDDGRIADYFYQRKRMREHLSDGESEEDVLRAWAVRKGGSVTKWRNVLHVRRPDMRKRRHEFE